MPKRVINLPNIRDEINLALKYGFHRFILVVGEKNLGKSTLCLRILNEIFKTDYESPMEIWGKVFRHLSFTPRQFYELYTNIKGRIDKKLTAIGLDPSILNVDVETDWSGIVEKIMDLDLKVEDFTKYRESYRSPGILIDDMGAHLYRGDISIYHDPFFQKLFADLTLIRPYIACLLGTAPDVGGVPRMVLKHVTDIINVESQGKAHYRKIRKYIRFKGKNIEGFMRMYDGDPVEWEPLPPDIYARYEVLRHLLSRKVSLEAMGALSKF